MQVRRWLLEGKSPSEEGWLRSVVVIVLLVALVVLAITVGAEHKAASSADTPPGTTTSVPVPAGAEAIDPSYFAAGSCVRYPPTQGNLHKTVFLDAGHGGQDPGAVGTTESGKTIYEADETLPVELDTMALLRAEGFTVVVSRTRASTVLKLKPGDLSEGVLSLVGAHDEVAARDICANDAQADVLVGIYFDWGDSPSAAGSLTTYDADRPFSSSNLKLSKLLQNSELAALNAEGWQIPNDGVLDDNGMGSSNGDPAAGGLAAEAAEYDHVMLIGPAMTDYFSTPSQMPGAIIEPLYITDPFEGSIAASAHGQEVMAEGIATGIERYFGLK